MLISKKRLATLENQLADAQQDANDARNAAITAEARTYAAQRDLEDFRSNFARLASRHADECSQHLDTREKLDEVIRRGTGALASVTPVASRILERIEVVTRLLPTDQEAGNGGIMVQTIRDTLADLQLEARRLQHAGEAAEELKQDILLHDAKQQLEEVLTGLLNDNGQDAGHCCGPYQD